MYVCILLSLIYILPSRSVNFVDLWLINHLLYHILWKNTTIKIEIIDPIILPFRFYMLFAVYKIVFLKQNYVFNLEPDLKK